MNQSLKVIKDFLQQKNQLTEQDKQILLKTITDADKQWNIKEFELDLTEKVKRTTAILLEETIEELDQQRTIVEEKNNELKIEAALERVRSRAMAMQKPNELVEVAQLLRKEMGLLGVEELETSSIYIHNETTQQTECWYAIQKDGKLVSDHMTIELYDTSVGREMSAFYGSDKKQTSIIMQGEARKEWINYCAGHSKVLAGFYGDSIPDRTYHLYKFSSGYVGAAAPGDISEESWDLLKRATNVFSLAYTRFNDLQIAEAQSRESQIQLALERVRARTMAMQHSDELPETSFLLFQQMKELGETAVQNSIGIIKEDAGVVELSTTVHGHPSPRTLNVPIDDPHVMAKAVAAWKAKSKSLIIEIQGQELREYNELRNSFLETKVNFPEDNWIVNIFFFSNGWLSFSSNK